MLSRVIYRWLKAGFGWDRRLVRDTEWNEVFPSATCVVTLVDRLVHHSEIISVEADSFRLREAEARQREKAR